MTDPNEVDWRMISIDPGGVHVGVAEFESKQGWPYCSDAYEKKPGVARLQLADRITGLDIVVWERFTLDPRLVKEQTGSEMPTCELIGVIKCLVENENARRAPGRQVAWQAVQRDAKTPAASWCRSRGIKSVAKKNGAGGHAKDAELIGWAYLIQTGLAAPGHWPSL